MSESKAKKLLVERSYPEFDENGREIGVKQLPPNLFLTARDTDGRDPLPARPDPKGTGPFKVKE